MKTLFAIIAVLAIAACAGAPSGTTAPTRFEYRVPSPPTGLYHIEDSVVVGLSTPVGDVETKSTALVTLNMMFADDPGGMGVVGTVVGFNASASNSLGGERRADARDVGGVLSLVLDRQGRMQLASTPEIGGELEDLTPFPAVAFEIFPRFPDHAVALGSTWVDTVTWSIVGQTSESTSTTVYTYTLQDDVILDGRMLQEIAVQGDVSLVSVEEDGDIRITHEMAGTTVGVMLWDDQRKLPFRVAMHRELAGTNSVPGAGRVQMTVSGDVRIWAVY